MATNQGYSKSPKERWSSYKWLVTPLPNQLVSGGHPPSSSLRSRTLGGFSSQLLCFGDFLEPSLWTNISASQQGIIGTASCSVGENGQTPLKHHLLVGTSNPKRSEITYSRRLNPPTWRSLGGSLHPLPTYTYSNFHSHLSIYYNACNKIYPTTTLYIGWRRRHSTFGN